MKKLIGVTGFLIFCALPAQADSRYRFVYNSNNHDSVACMDSKTQTEAAPFRCPGETRDGEDLPRVKLGSMTTEEIQFMKNYYSGKVVAQTDGPVGKSDDTATVDEIR